MTKRKKTGLYLRGKIWWMSFSWNGKHYQKSTGTDNRKLAEQIKAKLMTLLIEGKWFEKERGMRYTYDELMNRCITEHVPTLEPSTQKRYKVLRKHLDSFFSGMTLSEIDTSAILDYVEKRKREGTKPATRNREIGLLSKAFNLGKLCGMTSTNPCECIKREKEHNQDYGRILEIEEEKRLLQAAGTQLNGQLPDIITLALHTGMRRGEILNLKWKDIDFSRKLIHAYNEKANREKIVPMNEVVFNLLKEKSRMAHISGYIFHTGNGTPISPRNLNRAFQKAMKIAQIKDFRFHDLRHTAASRLVQAGADLYSVATILDHSQLSTTQRYAKHNPESVRKHLEKLVNFGG